MDARDDTETRDAEPQFPVYFCTLFRTNAFWARDGDPCGPHVRIASS